MACANRSVWNEAIAVNHRNQHGGVGRWRKCRTSRDVSFVGGVAQAEQSNQAAIVVGVENYDERLTGFRKLDYSADDANLIGSALQSIGYSAQQIEILTDAQATKDIVLNRIRQRARALGKDGTLVFFFSGHGFAQGDENYFATYGAVASELGASGLAVRDVVAAIRQSGVRRAVLLLDACRNNSLPGSKSANTGFVATADGEGVQILFSTRYGDISWEQPELQHGVFSYFLANGLRDNLRQFSQLADYVEREVMTWTINHKVQVQEPHRAGEYRGGDFLLASAVTPSAPQPEPVASRPPVPVTRPEPVQIQPAPQEQPSSAVTSSKLISGRYLDNGDGTITDTKTQLMWKKCSEGQGGDNCSGEATTYTWDDAMAKFGKGEWRLPTIEELRTLVYCINSTPPYEVGWGRWDNLCAGKYNKRGTIDPIAFPNTPTAGFWSVSPHASNGGLAWFVVFGYNSTHEFGNKNYAFQVRLVRSGQ